MPLVPSPGARPAVLLNARAKKVSPRTIRAFRTLLPDQDVFVSESLTEAEGHVRAILSAGYRTLMIGGGDGTVSATLRFLTRLGQQPEHRRRAPPDLVVLRLGTGNALGAVVGAGRPVEDVRRVLEGRTGAPIPLRVLEDRARAEVFSFGSIGYDAQVLNDFTDVVEAAKTPLRRRMMKSFGGYLYAVVTRTIPAELRRPPTWARVVSQGRASVLDPETHEEVPLDPTATLFEGLVRALLVGTTPYYGYGMKVLPFAQRRADRFHLRVSTASIPFVFTHLSPIWKGTIRTDRFTDFLVEDVRIETSQPLALQVSGDARGFVDTVNVRLSERTFRLLPVS